MLSSQGRTQQCCLPSVSSWLETCSRHLLQIPEESPQDHGNGVELASLHPRLGPASRAFFPEYFQHLPTQVVMCFFYLHYEAGKALPCLRRWHTETCITCAAVLLWQGNQCWGYGFSCRPPACWKLQPGSCPAAVTHGSDTRHGRAHGTDTRPVNSAPRMRALRSGARRGGRGRPPGGTRALPAEAPPHQEPRPIGEPTPSPRVPCRGRGQAGGASSHWQRPLLAPPRERREEGASSRRARVPRRCRCGAGYCPRPERRPAALPRCRPPAAKAPTASPALRFCRRAGREAEWQPAHGALQRRRGAEGPRPGGGGAAAAEGGAGRAAPAGPRQVGAERRPRGGRPGRGGDSR